MQGCDSFRQAKWFTRGRPAVPRLWVVHDEEYPERPDSAEQVQAFFANGSGGRKASAHACVDNNSVAGCVEWSDQAYHAGHGPTNRVSIGVEHSGYAHQTRAEWLDPYGIAMLDRSARLYAEVGWGKYRIPPRRVTGAALRAAVAGAGPGGICGHGDITAAFSISGGHTDPGPQFPWDHYLTLCLDYSNGSHPTTPHPEDDDVPYSSWPQKDKDALIADIRKALLYPLTGSQPAHPERDEEWMNMSKLANQIASK